MSDWAHVLAQQIADDLGSPRRSGPTIDLVVCRLRLVREEGVRDGLERATNAVDKAFSKVTNDV